MFLTKIVINKLDIIKFRLFDNYRWKQELCRAITPIKNTKGISRFFQFRVYTDKPNMEVLVLSEIPPVILPFGIWDTKEIPQSFYQRSKYVFDVIVCPSVKKASFNEQGQKKKQGKRICRPVNEHIPWMERKLSEMGCTVINLSATPMKANRFSHKNKLRSIPSTRFTGVIQVTDQNAFSSKVTEGIGPEKAFGFGLLLLKPVA